MKLMIAAAILSIGFAACNNAGDSAKKESEALNMYVDSVNDLTPVYTAEAWTTIDNGYRERALLAEEHKAALNEEDRAKADASKAKYEALRAKYQAKIKEAELAAATPVAPNYKVVLRDALFGQGKVGDDMKFSFVTADNIREVYQNFVDIVADNKKKYSREDWDEIKVLYEALDTRKNEVEKDLSSKDNLKIAGLKIRFVSILDTHRPGSKIRENADAKK
ncbi:MAG: hypothetical protein ABI378_12530 [Chitinophagaceae bacterium]